MRSAFVRREIDQQHDELCEQVGVWSKKVPGAMAYQLRFDRHFRPLCELSIHLVCERFQDGLRELAAEKPRIKLVPKVFLMGGQFVSPAFIHVALIAVPEMIELERRDLIKIAV